MLLAVRCWITALANFYSTTLLSFSANCLSQRMWVRRGRQRRDAGEMSFDCQILVKQNRKASVLLWVMTRWIDSPADHEPAGYENVARAVSCLCINWTL